MRAILLIFALITIQPAPANASDSPVELVAEGRYDEARALIAQRVGGQPDEALHLAFLQALTFLRDGQPEQAEDLLRKILKAEPKFEPARRELVALLAATGRNTAALYQAETLLASTRDPTLKASLQGFVQAHQSSSPRGLSLRMALRPSSNANNGTDKDTVILGGIPFVPDPESRAQDAIGLSLGATAWNRWSIGEGRALSLSASLDTTQYDNELVRDETIASARFLYSATGPDYRFTIGPTLERTWENGDPYRFRYGLFASAEKRLGRNASAGLGLSVLRQSHDDLSYLDGQLVRGALSYQRTLSPDLRLSVALPFEYERTERAHLDHQEIGLSLGAERRWKNGLVSNLSLGYSADNYIGDYPLANTPRRDRITTAVLGLSHPDFHVGSFIPELMLTYTRSSSNIGFYDYTRGDIGLNLTQRF